MGGDTRLPDGDIVYTGHGPLSFWTMAPLHYPAKFDPFLSLVCAPTPSTLAQSKEGIKFCHLATLTEGGAADLGDDAEHEGRVLLRGRVHHQSSVQPGRSVGWRVQHFNQGTAHRHAEQTSLGVRGSLRWDHATS